MRKVKLLALLLAALMVVAAFAGCADTTEIEGEVDGLESRVEAIENALNGVQGSVSDLENSVSGIGSGIADNNTAVQGVLDALKDLESKLNETEKAPETETPVAGDSVDALKKRADELGALIGGLQAEVMANQRHYLAADYVAALQALTAAHTEIAASNTVAAMDAVYAALQNKLATFVRVDEKFYNYFIDLKGNYTGDDACVAKVKEALNFYDKVLKKHYADEGIAADKYNKYETDELDKKGEPVVVNLKTDVYDVMSGWSTNLYNTKTQAKSFVDRIEKLEPNAKYEELAVLVGEIAAWKKDAVALAPVHGDLVTNYAKLEAALEASLNYTVAETQIKSMTVESVFTGLPVNLFDDYATLVENNSHVLFVAVNKADGTFKLDEDKDIVYTADVYANINKAIDKWIDENDITEEVAEYIINALIKAKADPANGKIYDAKYVELAKAGKYFYAKYQNAEAFAATMAAEFESFKEGIAADIIALNGSSLQNSTDLVDAYKKNAEAINKWYDDSVKAYKDALAAEDKADKTAKNTRVEAVDTATEYAAVLEANFNEMVVLAGLGVYDDEAKTYSYGKANADNYSAGIVPADTKDTDLVKYPNLNYIQFYDFDDEEAETFLKTTFVAAQKAAKAINDKIADFPVLQQISVATVLTTIGGYHVSGSEDIDNDASTPAVPALLVVDKNFAAGTIAEYMAMYGKNGTAYGLNSAADLSSLVDMAAYEALVADVFARVEAIDDATSALNTAYDNLLGVGKEAIITTESFGLVNALVTAINEWKNAGGNVKAQVTEEYETVGEHKSYLLESVTEDYDSLTANTDFETVINDIRDRYVNLTREVSMLKSLYAMLDKVAGYSEIKYDTLKDGESLKGNYAVTALSKGSVVEKDGVATGQKWNASYVTFDAARFEFVLKTATVEFKTYDSQDTVTKSASKFFGFTADSATESKYDVKKTLANLAIDLDDKKFTVTQLLDLGTNLYDKFMVDNYGKTVAEVETARENFVVAKGGYELYGWVVAAADKVMAADPAHFDEESLKLVTTLDALKLNLSSTATGAGVAETIKFGGYKLEDLTADFALKHGISHADLGIEDAAKVYDIAPVVVWDKTVIG